MSYTTDPNDPNLTRGGDKEKTSVAPVYLVLSEEERAKGFIRPVRDTYIHSRMKDGSPMPKVILHEHMSQLEGCGAATKMGTPLAETYARDPYFYGYTYCVGCQKHLPVEEFTWEDGSVVGS